MPNNIGSLGETSLHADLKYWYQQPGDLLEVPLEGYIIDLVRDDLLVEFQTRHFGALRTKLQRLLAQHPVRLVHPIAQEKWIVRHTDSSQTPVSVRRSPRRGRYEFLFLELVRIPHLVAHPNFTLEILLTREQELLRDDGRGSWRRKGWSITDRHLIEVIDRQVFSTPLAYLALLPEGLSQPFTNRDLAAGLHIPTYLAAKMSYCLSKMGVIFTAGKRSRQNLYSTLEFPNATN